MSILSMVYGIIIWMYCTPEELDRAELKLEELKANWEIAMNSKLPFRIEPLK